MSKRVQQLNMQGLDLATVDVRVLPVRAGWEAFCYDLSMYAWRRGVGRGPADAIRKLETGYSSCDTPPLAHYSPSKVCLGCLRPGENVLHARSPQGSVIFVWWCMDCMIGGEYLRRYGSKAVTSRGSRPPVQAAVRRADPVDSGNDSSLNPPVGSPADVPAGHRVGDGGDLDDSGSCE